MIILYIFNFNQTILSSINFINMKKGLLIIGIFSLLFTSCGLFKAVMNENGRKYYINKKGEKMYLAPNNATPIKKNK